MCASRRWCATNCRKAIDFFQAIGGCGIVMDVTTGEVLAMVSLPDYDANDFGNAPADDRFNRAVTGMYEPGSTFKLQTASMALDSGIVHIWDQFDAAHPIHIGRFTITDFEGKHRCLYLPEVLAYSSNLGAAHIADTVGGERQRAWLEVDGHVRPRRHRTARGRAYRSSSRHPPGSRSSR